MKNILCIIGESGSGKTHVANYIETKHGIEAIKNHTDRPKRSPDESGHTFHTKESFDKLPVEDYIAYTVYGGYRYCATRQDVKPYNVYVIDEPGLEMLLENHQDEFKISSLRIIRNYMSNIEKDRLERNLETYKMPLEKFDYVLYNNRTLDELEKHVDEIIETYLK